MCLQAFMISDQPTTSQSLLLEDPQAHACMANNIAMALGETCMCTTKEPRRSRMSRPTSKADRYN